MKEKGLRTFKKSWKLTGKKLKLGDTMLQDLTRHFIEAERSAIVAVVELIKAERCCCHKGSSKQGKETVEKE